MNCPNCGSVNDDNAIFCFSCGTKFEASQPAAAEQPVPATPQAQPLNPQMAPAQAAPVQEAQPAYVPLNYQIPTKDNGLRAIAFFTMLVSCICVGWTLVPLAWMIPMTIHGWGVYKGKKPLGTAFAVLTIFFCNILGGILLCCSNKDK